MDYMVNTLCIVQARLTSSRLPNKVLLELGRTGLSLLEHVNLRLQQARLIDKIVFAIPDTVSNDSLESFLRLHGIECFRGSEDDVLDRFYQCALVYHPHMVVRATCDNPFVDWELADSLISFLGDADYAYCSAAPLGTSVEVFSMDALIRGNKEAVDMKYREHVCPYFRDNRDKFVCKDYRCKPLSYRLTVDEADDFKLVNLLYKDLYKGTPISNRILYQYLEEHPSLALINRDVLQKRV